MIFPKRQIFNFDTALRYIPVVKMIEQAKFKDKSLLEVGSGMNGISDYYEGEVVGMDSDFFKTGGVKNQNIRHIKGIITNLPITNQSFNIVLCLDTLEHVPAASREKAVLELLRVTKKGGVLFIGYPTGNLASRFEYLLNLFFLFVHKKDHIWLLEHKRFGLPSRQEIISVIRRVGFKKKIKILGNANLLCWFIMHLLFTAFPSSIPSRFLKIFYKLVYYLLAFNLPPFYRVILVVKK